MKWIVARTTKKADRFKKEIEAHAALSAKSAPNIITVIDHGITEEGGVIRGYIVMPKAIQSLHDSDEVFIGRVELALEVFSGIVRGIQHAHNAGVIHRDIKPANILFLDKTFRNPLVSDFGICFLKDTPAEHRLTEVAETVGARFFMAPEQERGGQIDVSERADIYALGKLLHFMLTGRHLQREYVNGAFTPDELERDPRLRLVRDWILAKTVVEDATRRLESADKLQAEIARILGASQLTEDTNHSTPSAETLALVAPVANAVLATPLSSIHPLFLKYRDRIAKKEIEAVSHEFDEFAENFEGIWQNIHGKIKAAPTETEAAVREIIWSQPAIVALIFAISRCNCGSLFTEVRGFLEWLTRSTEKDSGYVAVQEVPHVYAGFLYMASAMSALAREGWTVLQEVLNARIQVPDSQRGRYAPGFAQPQFFHSYAFNRTAANAHNFFREQLCGPEVSRILRLRGDAAGDTYIQVQMLMCLKAAQMNEQGQSVRLWADFARFMEFRVVKLFDRMQADENYAKGICLSFGETPSSFFEHLNERIRYIRENFWRGGGSYFWESIESYQHHS